MNPNGPIETPDLRALLNAHRDELFASFNAHQLGTIVSFDAANQTATVSINALRIVYDRPQTENGALQQAPRLVAYPPLSDVPVFVASGGAGRLTLPIAAGDTCLVLFNDRDIDAWWASGQIVAPNSSRMHSLSDGLALVGFRSLANKIDDYEAANAVLRLGDSVVRIKPDGAIEVAREGDDPGSSVKLNADGSISVAAKSGATIALKTTGEIEALSSGAARLALKADGTAVLSLSGSKVVVNSDGSVEMFNAVGSQVKLAGKVHVVSTSGNLLTALQAVVTALTALNLKTGPSAAAQIAAASTAISDVLE